MAYPRAKNGLDEEERQMRELQAMAEQARVGFAESTRALRRRARAAADWRPWFRQHPGRFLAGAFLLGFYLGRR